MGTFNLLSLPGIDENWGGADGTNPRRRSNMLSIAGQDGSGIGGGLQRALANLSPWDKASFTPTTSGRAMDGGTPNNVSPAEMEQNAKKANPFQGTSQSTTPRPAQAGDDPGRPALRQFSTDDDSSNSTLLRPFDKAEAALGLKKVATAATGRPFTSGMDPAQPPTGANASLPEDGLFPAPQNGASSAPFGMRPFQLPSNGSPAPIPGDVSAQRKKIEDEINSKTAPMTGKQKIFNLLAMAAPVALGGAFGGWRGAAGAAEGVTEAADKRNQLRQFQLHDLRTQDEKLAQLQSQQPELQARTEYYKAQTQNVLHPQKPTAAMPEFDKAGNILGFRDVDGTMIGPNSPKLTQDMKDIMDAAEGRVTSQGTPAAQAMAFMVKSGMNPTQAYAEIKRMDSDARPDTATQNKQQYQSVIAKLTSENGNQLDPGILTDPRKTAAAISSSRTLTPQEKQFGLSYIAANPTPASQIFVGSERGASYGQARQYSVLDTRNGNRPIYVSADELNRANNEEPGRYLASGPGTTALNKENLMEDIRGGVQSLRSALQDPGLPEFTAGQKTKIAFAMRERDPRSAISSLITSGVLGRMDPKQEDYLIAHSVLAEQAMAMRTVLGAGQGSQDLRSAITATFPGPTTPNKAYALKQLDAFEQTINRLERGIPSVPLKPMANSPSGGGNNTPPTLTAPTGMITVQIPGYPPGRIPASARKQFLQDNPGAKVIE